MQLVCQNHSSRPDGPVSDLTAAAIYSDLSDTIDTFKPTAHKTWILCCVFLGTVLNNNLSSTTHFITKHEYYEHSFVFMLKKKKRKMSKALLKQNKILRI